MTDSQMVRITDAKWFRALDLRGLVRGLGKYSRRVILAGILLGPLFWILDSWIDLTLFGEYSSFSEAFLHPHLVRLYMRLLVCGMFLGFGLYAAYLLDHAERVELDLRTTNLQLETLKSRLERMVVIDPLTGVFNRRKFHENMVTLLSAALRHQQPLALLMMDIDHFKKVNDQFGHLAGDRVLCNVIELIQSSVRSSDYLFRVGGEEFCLVAPMTDEEQALVLAEKIRQVVETSIIPDYGKITISIGVASFSGRDTPESLYAKSDAALYEAKRQGRNCVVANKNY